MSISRRGLVAAAAALPIITPTQSLAQMGKGRRQPPPETMPPPLARDEFERNAFDVLADIHQNQQYLNVSRDDGRMLRIFAELAGTKKAIELAPPPAIPAYGLRLPCVGPVAG